MGTVKHSSHQPLSSLANFNSLSESPTPYRPLRNITTSHRKGGNKEKVEHSNRHNIHIKSDTKRKVRRNTNTQSTWHFTVFWRAEVERWEKAETTEGGIPHSHQSTGSSTRAGICLFKYYSHRQSSSRAPPCSPVRSLALGPNTIPLTDLQRSYESEHNLYIHREKKIYIKAEGKKQKKKDNTHRLTQ